MLVRTICTVPDEIFLPALNKINDINWDHVTDPGRKNSAAFETSSAIHLRAHRAPVGKPKPKTVAEWSVITECIDVPGNISKYAELLPVANWMMEQVQGIAMGRIMLINLAPRGVVKLHVDPLDYFAMYSRFHVPFKTNPGVVFNGGPDTANEHMAQQHLCQLNNRLPHSLQNNSDQNRIHLLVDVAVEGGNQIF